MTVITLPRSAIKEMNDKYVKIEIPDDKVTLTYADIEAIKKTRGLLKDKKSDLLNYIKKSREEWNRL
jgi:thiazole synthase ThiGH ThiG subunit